MARFTSLQLDAMNSQDEQFIKALGARIAHARKEHAMTQQQLADVLGIAQQTMAHYEGGRLKLSITLVPPLAKALNMTLDQLLGLPSPKQARKRGPSSRLEQQIEIISQLPKTRQKFVSEMLDTVIGRIEE